VAKHLTYQADCGHPSGDNLPLCTSCTAALVKELRAVPGVVADLAVASARLDRMSSGHNGGRSSEAPLPMRTDITRRLDALGNTLTTWARVVAEHEHIAIVVSVLQRLVLDERDETYERTQPDRISYGKTIPGETVTVLRHPAELSLLPVTSAEVCALWLSRQPQALRSLPAALEAHDDITDTIASRAWPSTAETSSTPDPARPAVTTCTSTAESTPCGAHAASRSTTHET